MLPDDWEKKLVDMNVTELTDEHLKWADYVFISAMVIQKNSVREIINRGKKLGAKIVAGGPLFTTGYEEFDGVDHFVLDEAEITLPLFLQDFAKGSAQHIYTSNQRPDIRKTPIPQWSLINMKKYSAMSVQYSRGCPYDCEFCDITVLNGHKPRTKDKDQLLAELDALYNQGWRGGLLFVDDNFIANKRKLKVEILPAIIDWAKERGYPFSLYTQTSINLADDEELMQLMVKAGFTTVFIGIETPDEESLSECNKLINKNRDLVASVRKIQNHGLEVLGGFIVGFDSDPISIFKSQISFIQKSGIVTAMVGLLQAPKGTRLYQRLKRENRLLRDISGDNMDCSINFIPKMNYETLINGYKKILNTIYSPKQYYERVKVFLKEYKPQGKRRSKLQLCHISAFIKSMWFLGIKERGRRYYWKLLLSTLLRRPRLFPLSVSFAITGFHFRKIVEKYTALFEG
ncbi:B12-binding domain-containing radical SAM protein [Dehalococcoidales bacterium]|nr:B12-binding domain-containing radical SAM protein [Dehalococcoidales bacterium]